MNRQTIMKIVVVLAILAALLVAFRMWGGTPAALPASTDAK